MDLLQLVLSLQCKSLCWFWSGTYKTTWSKKSKRNGEQLYHIMTDVLENWLN